MTRSPVEFKDSTMIGGILQILNIHYGSPIDEYLLLWCMMVSWKFLPLHLTNCLLFVTSMHGSKQDDMTVVHCMSTASPLQIGFLLPFFMAGKGTIHKKVLPSSFHLVKT